MNQIFDLSLFDEIDSTSSSLLRFSSNLTYRSSKFPLFVAESQTQGRGTREHKWVSSAGHSLTFSFVWCFDKPLYLLPGLSLVISLAIVRALKTIGIYGLLLKWPNDILFGVSKLGGVLIEVSKSSSYDCTLVIGVGLNVNFSSTIVRAVDRNIIDLLSIVHYSVNRNKLLVLLLHEIVKVLFVFSEFGFVSFKNEWNKVHSYTGKTITLLLPNGYTQLGIVEAVDEDGSLILILPSGLKNKYYNGFIS